MAGAKKKPNSGFKEAPHYHGHRDRLRARFREAGAEALADYELLELLLFRALPRRDVKPLAKALLAHFGSFAEGKCGARFSRNACTPSGASGRKKLIISSAREWSKIGVLFLSQLFSTCLVPRIAH